MFDVAKFIENYSTYINDLSLFAGLNFEGRDQLLNAMETEYQNVEKGLTQKDYNLAMKFFRNVVVTELVLRQNVREITEGRADKYDELDYLIPVAAIFNQFRLQVVELLSEHVISFYQLAMAEEGGSRKSFFIAEAVRFQEIVEAVLKTIPEQEAPELGRVVIDIREMFDSTHKIGWAILNDVYHKFSN